MPTFVKTFFVQMDDLGDADARINKWVRGAKVQLVDVKTEPVTGGVLYTILYQGEPADSAENVLGPPLPLMVGAKAPTVWVTRIYTDGKRPAQAMAGIFGVPEGEKFSFEDESPAPVPLFSPDVNLLKYYDMFENLEKSDER